MATALYMPKNSKGALKTAFTFHHTNQKDHRAHFVVNENSDTSLCFSEQITWSVKKVT